MATISEATRRTITTYSETVCLRCDEVINGLGESPMNAVRSYQLGMKLTWSQAARCAAAGAEIRNARA